VSNYTIRVEQVEQYVTVVEFERPPVNFFSPELIGALADTMEGLAEDGATRALILRASGKHFSAGADFTVVDDAGERQLIDVENLYRHALRLFCQPLPVVACLQGAVIGGGLGLAMSADFRVAATDSRISANFARLGIHQGFGLSVTLPRAVGQQIAADLLYTGRSLSGTDAADVGLVDRVAAADDLGAVSLGIAAAIAAASPLAVRSIRRTMRAGLLELVSQAVEHEIREQRLLFETSDFDEGVSAARERRRPEFSGS
jgi:2-(1,2-epoxy-1,2-dihydrophenyl)acetyl-CoA isomerase